MVSGGRSKVVVSITAVYRGGEEPSKGRRREAAEQFREWLQIALVANSLDDMLTGCAVAVWVEEDEWPKGVTDARIEAEVKRMKARGMDIGLDGQYARWRVTTANGSRDLSPRASNREIMDWLLAFEMGWDAGIKERTENWHKYA